MWACHHFVRLRWPEEFFDNKDLWHMHFESIHAQMECGEERKITMKMIPDLTDIPKWKDQDSMSISKHFRDC
jgi:hypothetical protein